MTSKRHSGWFFAVTNYEEYYKRMINKVSSASSVYGTPLLQKFINCRTDDKIGASTIVLAIETPAVYHIEFNTHQQLTLI